MDPDNPIDQLEATTIIGNIITINDYFAQDGKPYWQFAQICSRRFAYKCQAQEDFIERALVRVELALKQSNIIDLDVIELKKQWTKLKKS